MLQNYKLTSRPSSIHSLQYVFLRLHSQLPNPDSDAVYPAFISLDSRSSYSLSSALISLSLLNLHPLCETKPPLFLLSNMPRTLRGGNLDRCNVLALEYFQSISAVFYPTFVIAVDLTQKRRKRQRLPKTEVIRLWNKQSKDGPANSPRTLYPP